ncbi:hypothetical protein UACE39S_06051 [Ureibacillus acetophenoni]
MDVQNLYQNIGFGNGMGLAPAFGVAPRPCPRKPDTMIAASSFFPRARKRTNIANNTIKTTCQMIQTMVKK